MSTMSRTSTITPEVFNADTSIYQGSIEMLPIEVLSLTPNRTSSKIDLEDGNFDNLMWLFELLSSNITLITISNILSALLYHTFHSIHTGFQDICFNGSASQIEQRTSSSSSSALQPSSLFDDKSNSSAKELLQWMELLTPAIAPMLQKRKIH